MSVSFSQIKIGQKTLMNRFIRSATCEALSDKNGLPSNKLLKLIRNLSHGKVGLIIPGYVYMQEGGKAMFGQTRLSTEEEAERWRETISEVHSQGSKIMFQAAHGGANVLPEFEKVSPSNIDGRELKVSEIEDIIESFRKAAILSHKVGADGIQLHGAHGYLLSYFMSPAKNKRCDKYGGSLENNLRIIEEITESIRQSVPEDFIIGIKMNGDDCIEGGVNKDIASRHVNILKSKLDFFEISCSIGVAGKTIRNKDQTDYFEGYNLEYASYIKEKNRDAIISSVGGFRSLDFIESTLKSGKSDLISLSRPFIRDPNCVKRFESGSLKEVECKSCGHCFARGIEHGLQCSFP